MQCFRGGTTIAAGEHRSASLKRVGQQINRRDQARFLRGQRVNGFAAF